MNAHLGQLLQITEPLAAFAGARESDYLAVEDDYGPLTVDRLHRRQEQMVSAERDLIERIASRLGVVHDQLPDSMSRENPEERERADTVLLRLLYPTHVDSVHGLDFILELRRSGGLLLRFERVFSFLVSAGSEGWLDREDHGMGYHFHYVTLRDRWRTNVLLTFDRKEVSPPDTLYWEHHGHGFKVRAFQVGASENKGGLRCCEAVLIEAWKDSLQIARWFRNRTLAAVISSKTRTDEDSHDS